MGKRKDTKPKPPRSKRVGAHLRIPPQHLDIVASLMAKCLRPGTITRQLSREIIPNEDGSPNLTRGGLGVSQRTIVRYIRLVREQWVYDQTHLPPNHVLVEIERDTRMIEDVYQAALRKGDHFNALGARDRRAARLGILPDPKATPIQLVGANGGPIQTEEVSDKRTLRERILAGIEEIIAKRKKDEQS